MTAPLILWFRRDLRLADHPMLDAAAATGRPLVPLFILDPETSAIGTAPRWRLGLSVAAFGGSLTRLGSRLTFRTGPALEVLRAVAAESGADRVWWSRLYDPVSRGRDGAVKAALREAGLEARSFPGHLLAEPWELRPAGGGFYQVFTPYWTALRRLGFAAPLERSARLAAPKRWPQSAAISDFGPDMRRGGAVALAFQRVGEAAAGQRLARFLEQGIDRYAEDRDQLGLDATSGLSESLSHGEISPRQVWYAAYRALVEGRRGAETFLKELAWREFAHHLAYHTPHITSRNWREDWDGFPWRGDNADAEAWRRGMTGESLVDAAMRELYVTGRMHNRARMVAASYLTKHLLTDWRVGQSWFAQTLTDWDPASNALGWQWVAGSGPDAAPYFRIFNPEAQAGKFDAGGGYRARWLAPDSGFFDAVPRSWHLDPHHRPPPLIGLAEGRARALAAYAQGKA